MAATDSMESKTFQHPLVTASVKERSIGSDELDNSASGKEPSAAAKTMLRYDVCRKCKQEGHFSKDCPRGDQVQFEDYR